MTYAVDHNILNIGLTKFAKNLCPTKNVIYSRTFPYETQLKVLYIFITRDRPVTSITYSTPQLPGKHIQDIYDTYIYTSRRHGLSQNHCHILSSVTRYSFTAE